MRHPLLTTFAIGAMATSLAAPAFAQSTDPGTTTQTTTTQTTTTQSTVGPNDPYCGAWVNGTWTPNGNCVADTATDVRTRTADAPSVAVVDVRVPQRITGTITGVKGHLVTLQQSTRQLVIDDTPALDNRATGPVANGRAVVAHGYWKNGTFYATRLESATP